MLTDNRAVHKHPLPSDNTIIQISKIQVSISHAFPSKKKNFLSLCLASKIFMMQLKLSKNVGYIHLKWMCGLFTSTEAVLSSLLEDGRVVAVPLGRFLLDMPVVGMTQVE